jgi:Family of unknown function (DUF6600)/FecR protein
MKPRIRFTPSFLTLVSILLLAAGTAWAQGNSNARVVRLGFVQGDVTVQRPDVQAWSEAPVNTPLAEGFKLSTGDDSFAEIQFENGGTARLGEGSMLDLSQLERTPDGGTVTHVDLREGYATFNPQHSSPGEPLQVGTAYGTISAQGGALFRVDLQPGAQRVEVFAGIVDVQSNIGNFTLDQDSVLLLEPGAAQPAVVSHGITKDDWDNWVDDRAAQLQAPPNAPAPGAYTGEAGGSTYGWNDLLQYGTWSSVPGYGDGWSPNWVASGWSPYSTGQWCWYPGWGYTWIGTEPWGWLPYHYGGWSSIPGKGWVWFPVSLRNWSPGRVTWFHGPGWVGWTPRHIKDEASCQHDCGGGAVSTATLRNGGRLTSHAFLGINPASGARVQQPGALPTPAARLTGRAVSFRGTPPSNSTIVYDPQQHSYVNSDRVMSSAPPVAGSTPAGANTAHVARPGHLDPVPVGQGPNQTPEMQGYAHPITATGGPHNWRSAGAPGYGQPFPGVAREHNGRTEGNQPGGQPPSAAGSNALRMGPSAPGGRASSWAAAPAHGGSANPPSGASHASPSVGRAGGGHGGGGGLGGGHSGGGQAGGGGGHAAGGGGNASPGGHR